MSSFARKARGLRTCGPEAPGAGVNYTLVPQPWQKAAAGVSLLPQLWQVGAAARGLPQNAQNREPGANGATAVHLGHGGEADRAAG